MDRILVGVDDSPNARDALAWAADLAGRGGFELTAARVFVPPQAEFPPDQDTELHRRQLHELQDWCGALPDSSPPVRTVLLDGDPASELLAAAIDQRADLLVIGGRGAGGFLHLHIGSVAHHLVHHTTLPLAVVPPGADPAAHLVVGLDGSEGSLAAARLCAQLAPAIKAGVTAVRAFEPFLEWVPANDPTGWRARAESEVRDWVAPIDATGTDVDVEVDRDINPVAALARTLQAHPGSAAVIGTRGTGGFNDLRLGRVPLQLLHHTNRPVIVVPPPQ